VKAGLRVLSIRSLVVGLVLAACQPSTASVTIRHPGERAMVYGYLDVSVRAVVADPRSVEVWVDDGARTRGPWLRIDTRTLDEGMHVVFTRSGRHRDRIDFTVSHAVPRPTRGTVNVYGDSLTSQVIGGVGTDTTLDAPAFGLPAATRVRAMAGVVARDFLGVASGEAADGRAEVLVVALGTNDAMKDGWDRRDSRTFQKLIGIPSPETCVALLLPGYGATLPRSVKDDIDAARSTLRTIADRAPGVVAVDSWQREIDADAAVVRPSDQIHLNDEEGFGALVVARTARARANERAVESCRGSVGKSDASVPLIGWLRAER